MSPKNKKKLNILRNKLDKLDYKLLSIIKIRTEIIKNVISLKNNKKEIVDKKRIAFILRKIKKASIKGKIDPTITNKIWKNMISTYIDFERKLFKKK
jgi:chorismate mutase